MTGTAARASSRHASALKRLAVSNVFFNRAVTLCFALLTLVGLWHHEPWGDETDAWLVARDMSVGYMLTEHLRYAGAPALWYLLLMPFAKLGFPYFTQPLLHWLLAVATVQLFVARAPFSRLFKIAFVFSVHMAFEYTLVARHYVATLLFLFMIASSYPYRFRFPLRHAALVFLLFHTNVHSFIPAVALTAAYLWEITRREFKAKIAAGYYTEANSRVGFGIRNLPRKGGFRAAKRAYAGQEFPPLDLPGIYYAAIGVMALGGLLLVLTVYPQPEDIWSGLDKTFRAFQPAFFLHALGEAFFPESRWTVPAMLAGAAVAGYVSVALRGKPAALFFLLSSLAWLFYIFCIKYGGSFRHFGLILIFAVFSLWIGFSYRFPDARAKKACSAAMAILLCCLLYSDYVMLRQMRRDYAGAFSASVALAEFIKENGYENRVVVTHRRLPAMPFLPDTRFWIAGEKRYGSYATWDKTFEAGRTVTHAQILANMREQFPDLSKVLLVLTRPLDDPEAEGMRSVFALQAEKDECWVYEPIVDQARK